MFKLNIQDFVVGCSYWILKIDNTLLLDKILPQKYVYIGKFDEIEENEHFLFRNDSELKIPYNKNGYMAIDIFDVGNFIIYSKRSKVIQVVRNVATRPIMDKLMNNTPSKYIKLLEDIKPELLI